MWTIHGEQDRRLEQIRERQRTRGQLILWAILLGIVAGLGGLGYGCTAGCGSSYSSGDRAGIVVKLSRKGVLLKSWEGAMTQAGAAGGMPVQQFEFSTRDEALASQLGAALQAGKPCVVQYQEWLVRPMTLDTGHEVVSVRCEGR